MTSGFPQPRPGETIRVRGERWRVSRLIGYDTAAIVDLTGSDRGNAGVDAHFLLPFETIERHSPAAPRVVSPARWRRAARSVLTAASEAPLSLRTARAAAMTVMPFQLEPVVALLAGRACRVLIADEVGLGKTVQAGLIAAELLARDADARAIVVCPAGLRDQWRQELRERFGLDAAVVDATFLAQTSGTFGPAVNPWAMSAVVITSIDFLKRPEVIRSLEALLWDVAIFDEAHGLAGRSDRAQAAALLAERARHVVMLTATPHSGDDLAFERLCDLGNLQPGFPLLMFRRTRQDAGFDARRRTTWLKVRPTDAEAAMHRALGAYARRVAESHAAAPAAPLAMSVLARRACSSAAALVRSLQRRIAWLTDRVASAARQLALPFADVSGDEEPGLELAAPGLADRDDEVETLARLLNVATSAAAAESKTRALERLLRRARQPLLLFTEYRDTLAMLASRLAAWQPLTLHGGLTPRERRDAARGFSHGNAALLLATDAASEGLNLHQRCRLVVNLELPWTPARLEQRIGRVDRIGQQQRVHAVHLVAARTSEEHVVARLLLRSERVGEALDPASSRRTAEDIAGAIVGHPHCVTPPLGPRRMPYDVAGVSVRAAAEHEGQLILRTRMLAGSSSHRDDQRPLLTILRRRPRRRCWAFALEYDDADGRVLWRELIGLAAACGGLPARSATSLRQLLRVVPALEQVVEQEHEAGKARVQSALGPALLLAHARERAMLDAAAARRAKLAALLVQPGLFGRAASDRGASQAAAVEELTRRCAARVRRLEGTQNASVGYRELLLAWLGD